MPTPIRPRALQRLCYPRPPHQVRGIPFHGLMGWGFGNPERLVAGADLVVAIDVMTREQMLVYGEVALFPIEFGGQCAAFLVLAVELDFDTPEVEALAALVEQVRGDHDLPWEIV